MASLGITQHSLRVGQIAQHCEVNPRTVHRWIKEGKLESFVLPSGHYRVTQNNFRRFLLTYNFPLTSTYFDLGRQDVLVVDCDKQRVEILRRFFVSEAPQMYFEQANTLMAAALSISLNRPQLIFVSFVFDPRQFQRFCLKLKERQVAKWSLIHFVMDKGDVFDLPHSLKTQARLMELPFDSKNFKRKIKDYIYV